MANASPSLIKRRSPWVFGVIFMAVSMAIEIALLVVGRLRIPQDNATIAPILLIASPLIASWFCHYRRLRDLLLLSFLAVLLTLLFVLVFSRLTGISTGIFPPIVLRTAAGFVAALIVNRKIVLSIRNHPHAIKA
jgi:hypothetical protein